MYWFEKQHQRLLKHKPSGTLRLCGGITPGEIHIGSYREAISLEILRTQISNSGRSVEIIYFIDDIDPVKNLPYAQPYFLQDTTAGLVRTIISQFNEIGCVANYRLSSEIMHSHIYWYYDKLISESEILSRIKDNWYLLICTSCAGIQRKQNYISRGDFLGFICQYCSKVRVVNKQNGMPGKFSYAIEAAIKNREYGVDFELHGIDHQITIDRKEAFYRNLSEIPPIYLTYGFITNSGQKLSKSQGDGDLYLPPIYLYWLFGRNLDTMDLKFIHSPYHLKLELTRFLDFLSREGDVLSNLIRDKFNLKGTEISAIRKTLDILKWPIYIHSKAFSLVNSITQESHLQDILFQFTRLYRQCMVDFREIEGEFVKGFMDSLYTYNPEDMRSFLVKCADNLGVSFPEFSRMWYQAFLGKSWGPNLLEYLQDNRQFLLADRV